MRGQLFETFDERRLPNFALTYHRLATHNWSADTPFMPFEADHSRLARTDEHNADAVASNGAMVDHSQAVEYLVLIQPGVESGEEVLRPYPSGCLPEWHETSLETPELKC
jgi:hypothetical protein